MTAPVRDDRVETLRAVISDWSRDTREWKIATGDAEAALNSLALDHARLQQQADIADGLVKETTDSARFHQAEVARLQQELVVLEAFKNERQRAEAAEARLAEATDLLRGLLYDADRGDRPGEGLRDRTRIWLAAIEEPTEGEHDGTSQGQ